MDASVAVVASPRSSSSSRKAASPEFEFWIAPQPQVHTADELFSDGLLLPLHLLRPRAAPPCDNKPPSQLSAPAPAVAEASIATSVSCSLAWGSRRWRNLFKVGEKKERRRKERKSGGADKVVISIWPFYRSRPAGSAATASGTRPWDGARNSSSAPCSRSSSRGESSKSAAAAAGGRRRVASPGRAGGVYVGRSGPVWQIRPGPKGIEPAVGHWLQVPCGMQRCR